MEIQKQEKPLIVSRRNINNLITQMGWKGQGTSMDPLIIEDTFSEMVLSLKNFYGGVIIRNLKNKSIKLYKCENIAIENCSISDLSMTYCKRLHISNCLIVSVKLMYSRENIFSNSVMTRETLNEITSNISEQRMIKIQKATIPLVIFGLTMVFLNPYMYQSSFNETGWMVWVFLPFVVIVLGTAFIAIWASARKAQHLPPNQVKTPVIRSKQEIIGMFFG